jgi:dienelactone hydrolase
MPSTLTASTFLLLVLACGFPAQAGPPDAPPARPAEGTSPSAPRPAFETVTRVLPDRVVMTADLYRASAPATNTAPLPVLVCFHMTRSSRGEYRALAPLFVERGFHVLAVDLRFGGEGEKADRRTGARSGTRNETWTSAKAVLGVEPSSIEASPDIGEAVKWARELFPRSRVGLVGSSFSASLVLVYAAEQPEMVDAVVALSPGEYMQPHWEIQKKVRKLAVPTYITCGNTEADTNQAKPVAAAIQDSKRLLTFWPQDAGFVGDHGSRTFLVREEPSRAKQWEMLERALEPLRKPRSSSSARK